MGRLTNYTVHGMLNRTLNRTDFTPTAILYLVGCTASPGDAATGAACNEHPNTGAYARIPIVFKGPMEGGSGLTRKVLQEKDVVFPEATADWSDITHYAVADSGTHGAGNILGQGEYDQPYSVTIGSYMVVDAGTIWFRLPETDGSVGICTWWANQLMQRWFCNGTSYAIPVAGSLAFTLSTIAESYATLSNLEVEGTGYARKVVNTNASGTTPKWDVAASRAITHTDVITFATPGGDWKQAVSVVWCAWEPGNQYSSVYLFDNANLVNFTAVSGDVVRFQAGAFSWAIN